MNVEHLEAISCPLLYLALVFQVIRLLPPRPKNNPPFDVPLPLNAPEAPAHAARPPHEGVQSAVAAHPVQVAGTAGEEAEVRRGSCLGVEDQRRGVALGLWQGEGEAEGREEMPAEVEAWWARAEAELLPPQVKGGEERGVRKAQGGR